MTTWSAIVDECIRKIGDKWPDPPAIDRPVPGGKTESLGGVTGILYSGNIHETVPKQLFLDNRLTPLERNAWQVFKLLLDKQGFAAPRYEDLQPYLSMTPYGEKASKETVAKVIHILRLTRWLSLINKGRDKRTGQLLGSVYILHDEPITPAEALQLDNNYLEFVDNCCKHANKNVSIVAKAALTELQNSDNQHVQTRLTLLAQRIQLQSLSTNDEVYQLKRQTAPVRNTTSFNSESEPSKTSLVRNNLEPSLESELSLQVPICNSVRNPNRYSTSTVYIHNSTVLNHPLLKNINNQQQTNLLKLTNELDTKLVDQVFQEFEQRCTGNEIKNPIGYLFGLLKKAKNDEFKPWLTPPIERPINNSTHVTQEQAQPVFYRRDTNQPVPQKVQKQMQDLKNLLANRNKV